MRQNAAPDHEHPIPQSYRVRLRTGNRLACGYTSDKGGMGTWKMWEEREQSRSREDYARKLSVLIARLRVPLKRADRLKK